MATNTHTEVVGPCGMHQSIMVATQRYQYPLTSALHTFAPTFSMHKTCYSRNIVIENVVHEIVFSLSGLKLYWDGVMWED